MIQLFLGYMFITHAHSADLVPHASVAAHVVALVENRMPSWRQFNPRVVLHHTNPIVSYMHVFPLVVRMLITKVYQGAPGICIRI